MPAFTKGPGLRTPFGNHNFLRSTKPLKPIGYTCYAASVPDETIDGSTQKMLMKGEVIASITSGLGIGKVGPLERGTTTAAANESVLVTRDATAGTVDITLDGATLLGVSLVAATTAAGLLASLEGLPNVDAGDITVTGVAGGPFTVTFVDGPYAGVNAPNLTIDATDATTVAAVAATNESIVVTRTATGGTVDISLDGESTLLVSVVAATTAAALKADLEEMSNVNPGDITVTGANGGPFTITFVDGPYAGIDAPDLAIDQTNAVGGTVTGAITPGVPAVAATGATVTAVVTPGSAESDANGATDGRQLVANIVGINNTFLPWQLLERDVEIAVLYECVAVQANCFERDAAGARVALTNDTADAIRTGAPTADLAILFK